MALLTPHNEAQKGDYAKTVLMPGDPLRAKYIAETYLKTAEWSTVYGAHWDIRDITRAGGFPFRQAAWACLRSPSIPTSFTIFSRWIISSASERQGRSARNCSVRDIVIAMGACADSDLAGQLACTERLRPLPATICWPARSTPAKRLNISCSVGNVLTSDLFYEDSNSKRWAELGVIAEEMEAAALYISAAKSGKKALCICNHFG